MNICVCIKQVPDTTEIKIDPVTNTLIRDGVPSIVNPYDTYALENAARLKDKDPSAKIVVISMGPPQAKNALKECTRATSYILASAISHIEKTEGKFDCIFCGKQAIDGDTAQVGPEIAEHLGYPQVTYALECETAEGGLRVTQQGPDYKQILQTATPCVVTFTNPSFSVRYPNVRRKMAANRTEIPDVTAVDITDIDLTRCGLKGSATRVKKTYVPVRSKNGVILKNEEPDAAAKKLAELLSGANVI